MPDGTQPSYPMGCGSRLVIDQLADKWSVMILAILCAGPLRFNAVRRRIEGITQKALIEALRRLERNGIVERRVIGVSPVAVEYGITALGRSLQEPMHALHAWAIEHEAEVAAARDAFDRRALRGGPCPDEAPLP